MMNLLKKKRKLRLNMNKSKKVLNKKIRDLASLKIRIYLKDYEPCLASGIPRTHIRSTFTRNLRSISTVGTKVNGVKESG